MAPKPPIDPHDPGLRRRIVDSEAFIFVQESWRWFLLLVGFTCLVLGAMFSEERLVRAGLVVAVVFGLLVAFEWWRERQPPLPKPKPRDE